MEIAAWAEIAAWEEMEGDCLMNIFSRLGLDDLNTAVPLVCKAWRQASGDPLCCRILDFQDFTPPASFSGFLKLALARSRGAAVDLRFPSAVSVTSEDLSLASDECPRLRNLVLPRIESECEEQILNAMGKWNELEFLEMESKPSVLPQLVQQIGLHCTNFQGLKLRGSITKEDASAISEWLPSLKRLDLSGCQLQKADLLVIMDGCGHLRRLNARDCVGFELDEEIERRGSEIQDFDCEGSVTHHSCDLDLLPNSDISLEDMLMYYDDCCSMWLF